MKQPTISIGHCQFGRHYVLFFSNDLESWEPAGLASAFSRHAIIAVAPGVCPRLAAALLECRSERTCTLRDSGQGYRFRRHIDEFIFPGNILHISLNFILTVFCIFSTFFLIMENPADRLFRPLFSILLMLFFQKFPQGKIICYGLHGGDTLIHQVHIQNMTERLAKKLQAHQTAAVRI
jgi:hypothetical protein